jgi:hypothetical protein
MSFGWAYVDCGTSGGGQAAGPTGSVQFLTGANSTSGSASLLYHTSAYGGYTASTLVMTGTLVVDGIISASHYHIENVTEIDSSGSTYFGNSDNDLHSRTGSLVVIDEANNKILSASTTTEAVHVRGLNVLYEPVTGTSVTASAPSYILGVQNTSNVEILIPSASIYGSGSLLLVKDEVIRVGTNIRLSASSGYTIDGSSFYILTGTLPAISLYSNGANWFVF